MIWEVSWNPGSMLGTKWCPCVVVEALNPHGMAPTSSPNIWKGIYNLHMLWMGIWIHHRAIYNHTCCSGFEKTAEIRGHCLAPNDVLVWLLRLWTHMKWLPHPLQTYIGRLTTFTCFGWGYKSIIMPYTTTLTCHDLGSQLKSGVNAWHQMLSLSGCWGSEPSWNGSHIPSKHIKGDWQTSYAVDGDMDPSSCHYNHTCWSGFEKSAEIRGHCLAPNDVLEWLLRLWTHMEWFPYPLQTYKRWLTNFTCCGWGYGSIIMPLQSHLWVRIWDVSWNPGSLLGTKCYPWVVVEALNPHEMVPTSSPNIYKVIDNVRMLWLGIWIRHHAITITLVGQDLGSQLKAGVTAWHQMLSLSGCWGSKPSWDGSQIHSKHIRGDWQPSYAVDRDMDPSSCHYNHTCCSGFEKSAKIQAHCLAPNDVLEWLLRL